MLIPAQYSPEQDWDPFTKEIHKVCRVHYPDQLPVELIHGSISRLVSSSHLAYDLMLVGQGLTGLLEACVAIWSSVTRCK